MSAGARDGRTDAPSAMRRALLVALAVGAAIRGWHVLGADFALNDGGLFYVMVQDVQRAGYRLPAFTSYNGGEIPFGYSPLAFYVAALLNDATGASLDTLFRVLPLAASTACILAFHPLARDMVAHDALARDARRDAGAGRDAPSATIAVAAALLAFAIVPRGFVWLLMGGGLTRSFGYLFALLAIHRVWMLCTTRSLRHVPLATAFSALTVLGHLGTAPFVAFSALLLLLFRGRHRAGIVGSAAIGVGTALLTAPWWGAVVAAHGVEPFLAARATGGSVFSALPADVPGAIGRFDPSALVTTGEGRFPVVWLLAVAGALWCLAARRPLLPAWWVAILVLDTRAGFTYSVAPVAMLAGLAIARVVPSRRASGRASRGSVLRLAAAAAIVVLLAASAVLSARRGGALGNETGVLAALSPADRAAMRRFGAATDTSARVLVLTSVPWQIDRVSEWFPVLAGRRSVATVQGTEWLPRGSFDRSIRRQHRVAACATADAACLESLRDDAALQFTHVYVPVGPGVACCGPLVETLGRDDRYARLDVGEAAAVFVRR